MTESEKKELKKLQDEYFRAEQAYMSYRAAENMIISRLSRETTATEGELEYEEILEEKNQALTAATLKLKAFKASIK